MLHIYERILPVFNLRSQ